MVSCVAFKPDNPNILVSGSWDKTIKIKMWDITSGSCLSTLSCGSPVYTIALKDNMIVAGCWNGQIKLFKLNESQDWGEIQSEPPLRGHRYTPSLSREHFLSSFFSTNLVCLSSRGVNCVAFKPDNPNILVSGSWDKTIKMWDITSGSMLSTLTCDRYDATVLYDCPVCGHFTAECFNTVTLDHADYNRS